MNAVTKSRLLLAAAVIALAVCVWVLASSLQMGIDNYARCKAEGGETEFCLVGDGT